MPLFTICNISLRCPQNVSVKFQLKIPHRSFIISFCKPTLFQILCKKHLFSFDYHVNCAEMMCFKAISV